MNLEASSLSAAFLEASGLGEIAEDAGSSILDESLDPISDLRGDEIEEEL